jgi:hypothetical protein
MKKLNVIAIGIAGVIFSTTMYNNPAASQSDQKSRPIPADVMAVAKKSCVNCHAEPGKDMALMHVNLSKWDSYTLDKQIKKARAMCKMTSKGKMPPQSFKKKNPDFVLTKEEVKTICDWSKSIR